MRPAALIQSLSFPPWPRFVRCPCCSELGHTSNFLDPDFLKSIVSDLNKFLFQLRKLVNPATVLDGLELICGSGYNLEKVRQVVQSGWGDDPVHPHKHTYAKMALNLMEKMSASTTENRETSSRKRMWSSSNSDSGSGGSKSGGGGGGRPTHRVLEGKQKQQLTGRWLPDLPWRTGRLLRWWLQCKIPAR